MTAAAFDTLAVARRLKSAGFSEDQAEVMTVIIREARDSDLSTLATKADLDAQRLALKTDIDTLRQSTKAEFESLRQSTTAEFDSLRQSTKSEFDAIRQSTKTDIREVELRLEAQIEASRADTIKWVLSAIGIQTIVIVGAIAALSRTLV